MERDLELGGGWRERRLEVHQGRFARLPALLPVYATHCPPVNGQSRAQGWEFWW